MFFLAVPDPLSRFHSHPQARLGRFETKMAARNHRVSTQSVCVPDCIVIL